jgi:hypothetical protein
LRQAACTHGSIAKWSGGALLGPFCTGGQWLPGKLEVCDGQKRGGDWGRKN